MLNRGKKPTFVSSRYKTHIDISLATADVNNVHSWHVKSDDLLTDHKMIEFVVDFSAVKAPLVKKELTGSNSAAYKT